jgi:dTDP-4-dehydro-6-deoxy-alpha-D-glucopyranose 2,3-dehydratase
MDNEISYNFLKSALDTKNHYKSLDYVIKWLKNQNDIVNVQIEKTSFDNLKSWSFNDFSLVHDSGSFFSIDGIRVNTNWGNIKSWDQPIINQPEVGYLGFITKSINGVLHFLSQAKIEPGNVNFIQISPTLQATKSNYSQVHKGNKPLFLEYFQKATQDHILLDQLQSEQGARFLRKRNRNIIIQVEEDIVIPDNFIWLTLSQLKKLMTIDNIVNMDTRTVLSGINFGSYNSETVNFFNLLNKEENIESKFLKSTLINNQGFNSLKSILTNLTHLKSNFDLNVNKIPLKEVIDWKISKNEIFHKENKYFKIIAVDVKISNREVINWSQPMVEPIHHGLCAFVCKEIEGLLHFAVQAKLECGNHDIIEFAPTVQTLTGNYQDSESKNLPFLDYILNIDSSKIIYNSIQSEEGGRFYKEQNRNMIVLAGDEIDIKLPENFIWMTLNQMNTFLQFNNFLNIQARNLITLISFT